MYLFALREDTGAKRTVVFPSNPEELEVSLGVQNETYNLMEMGEVALPGYAGLRRVHFSCYLPAVEVPRYFLNVLDSFSRSKTLLRFIVSRMDALGSNLFDTNIPVIIEKFTWREKGGEPGAFFVDLTLVEYRRFGLRVTS